MSFIDTTKEHARIHNNRIIEYPVNNLKVTEEEIKSGRVRRVVDKGTDLVEGKFTKILRTLEVIDGIPTYVYRSVELTSSEFVQRNYIDLLKPYFHLPVLNVGTIPLNVVMKMVEAVKDLGTMELDRFAQTRGYDNIVSLVSYRGDPSPRLAAEGERGVELRSQYWSNLTEFNEKVSTGEIEFPRTIEGITDMFPNLTWN